MPEPLLVVDDVHASIGQHRILQGVSLAIRADRVTVLLGRNGSGKTTTMRTIVGLLHPLRGAVRYDGRPIDRLPPYEIARLGLGYVPEGQAIFGTLSVEENLRVAARTRRPDPAHLARVWALFPNLKRLLPAAAGTLSGGQKQMLAIARALVNDNRLLLIDEPSKGLAPIVIDHLVETLRAMKRHVTVLLVEQNFAMASAVGDDFYLIDDGRTVADGAMATLVADETLKRRYLGV